MRHVLAETVLGGVIDPNNHHGRHLLLADQSFGGLVDLPLHAREGSGRLEKILPIIEVEHRIAPCRILAVVVSGREPDAEESCTAEETAVKLVQAQITR